MTTLNYEEIAFDPSMLEAKEPIDDSSKEKKVENIFDNDDMFFKEDTKEVDESNPQPLKNIEDNKSLFSVVLGNDLVEKGVLSSFDEAEIKKIASEENDASAIVHMIKKQIELSNNEIKQTYDTGYQEYLNMIQGGVQKEEAAGVLGVENFISAVKQIDLKAESDEAVQARKDLLTLNYRLTTKWGDDKIQRYIDKMYDEGSDIEEIEEALSNVDTYITSEKISQLEQAKQRELQIKTSQDKQLNDLKTYIDKADEFFKGDKITKVIKDKMFKSITTPVKLANGTVTSELWASREENPTVWDSKAAYLHAIGFFKSDVPLDKFIKNAETKVTTGLQEYLNDTRGRSYNTSNNKIFGKQVADNDIDKALGL